MDCSYVHTILLTLTLTLTLTLALTLTLRNLAARNLDGTIPDAIFLLTRLISLYVEWLAVRV